VVCGRTAVVHGLRYLYGLSESLLPEILNICVTSTLRMEERSSTGTMHFFTASVHSSMRWCDCMDACADERSPVAADARSTVPMRRAFTLDITCGHHHLPPPRSSSS
jgi:hypothetical protein